MSTWGPLEWLAPKFGKRGLPRTLLGCLSAEERCLAAPSYIAAAGVDATCLVQVEDPIGEFTPRAQEKIEAHRGRLVAVGVDCSQILRMDLLVPDHGITAALERALRGADANHPVELWLDITSLPKRLFFLLTKLAVRDTRVDTLVITYTQPRPAGYASEALASNPDVVRPLPGFGPQAGEADTLVVAVGFEALGLPQLLSDFRDKKRRVVLLVPFPPGQPYSRRIWQTIIALGYTEDTRFVWRVPALDLFETLRRLKELAGTEAKGTLTNPPALAPYGPKPVSMGMCLYAMQVNAPVFYTQPRAYHPDYTLGIGDRWAYCVKIGGVARM